MPRSVKAIVTKLPDDSSFVCVFVIINYFRWETDYK